MTWTGGTTCEACLQEAKQQGIPPGHRMQMVEPVDCPKHGHPARLSPRLTAWVQFFEVIAPYSTDQALDHSLISKFCQEEQIPFVLAFEKLTWIQRIVKEVQETHGTPQPDDRLSGSKSVSSKNGGSFSRETRDVVS